jgi:putative flippase GtrA
MHMFSLPKKIFLFFISPQFVKFFVVGFSAFLVDFGLLTFQIYVLNFNPFAGIISIANVISVSVAIVYSFILQRTWTFRSQDKRVVRQGGKYVVVAMFSITLNNIIYGFMIQFGLIPPLAKFLVTSLQMCWSYVLYKWVVFRG